MDRAEASAGGMGWTGLTGGGGGGGGGGEGGRRGKGGLGGANRRARDSRAARLGLTRTCTPAAGGGGGSGMALATGCMRGFTLPSRKTQAARAEAAVCAPPRRQLCRPGRHPPGVRAGPARCDAAGMSLHRERASLRWQASAAAGPSGWGGGDPSCRRVLKSAVPAQSESVRA